MFAGGELRLLLLSLVAEQDRHGYELIKAVEELTGGQYAPSPGVVYPTLALLVDEGMIAEAAGEGARKAFTIAEAGRTELAARGEELSVIVERLTSLAKAGAQAESPPVRRAFANLGLALRQRVEQDGFDEETAHRIADILDEAARQIERLPKQA
ncbi:PadR family transcriptional regulator [Novosphingobium sp.]|uniref:PadR family transcriptional regulator n=1 Tax=Novosphingobium sp. TaxID=1874826 RepID=UPI002FDE4B7E